MSNIKCFVLASGANVISEYEEKESIIGGNKKEIYLINPMIADFTRTAQGQVALAMTLLVSFDKLEKVGPINENSIVFSYNPEDKFKNAYEEQIVKLRAARSGLIPVSTMPNMPNMSKIGGGMKLVK
jgi:hypothetical protein